MKFLMFASRGGSICLTVFLLTACMRLDPLDSERLAKGAADSATIGSSDQPESGSALQVDEENRHSARLSAQRKQEERRKATVILDFFGIEPGMVVLNMSSGDELYAELLSLAVGPAGRVVSQDNLPYLSFTNDERARTDTDGHSGNVKQSTVRDNPTWLAPNKFDAVIMIRSFRDDYYISEDTGWAKLGRPELLRELYSALKPGGVLGFIGDAADPAVVRYDMVSAGFVFDEKVDNFRDSVEDGSRPVFASSAGKLREQAVMRFHKPRRDN